MILDKPLQSQMLKAGDIVALVVFTLIFSIATFSLFFNLPLLDLSVADFFFTANVGFEHIDGVVLPILRRVLMIGFFIFYGGVIYNGLKAWKEQALVKGFTWSQWLYIGLANLIGPLFVANLLIKNNLGRARPREIEIFLGEEKLQFTQFWQWSAECSHNCSFISGETSSAVMIFISLALVTTFKRKLFFALIPIAYIVSGGMRMMMGAHFFSDTLMAIPIMLLVACVVYYWMFLSRLSPIPWIASKAPKINA